MLRIAVFEKHGLMRDHLAMLVPELGPYELVVATGDVAVFQEAVRARGGVDIAVLSALMDADDCCRVMQWLNTDFPVARKVAISLAALQAPTDRMVHHGAASVLCGGADEQELCITLHELEQPGSTYFTHLVREVYQKGPVEGMTGKTDDAKPTESEALVLKALCRPGGASDKELADHLGISIATVRSHLRHLFEKFDVHTRQELVDKARKLGYHI